MHRLAQSCGTADQRHEAEAADQARQRRDVDVAALGIDQRRAQNRPVDLVGFASLDDRLFGIGELVQHLAFGGDLAVELGDHACRREGDNAPQRRIEEARERPREQDGVG
jgi:hypothetical protein